MTRAFKVWAIFAGIAFIVAAIAMQSAAEGYGNPPGSGALNGFIGLFGVLLICAGANLRRIASWCEAGE